MGIGAGVIDKIQPNTKDLNFNISNLVYYVDKIIEGGTCLTITDMRILVQTFF